MAEPRFRFRPLRLRDALAVRVWRYPGDYAMYNITLAPLLLAALLRWPLRALTGVCTMPSHAGMTNWWASSP